MRDVRIGGEMFGRQEILVAGEVFVKLAEEGVVRAVALAVGEVTDRVFRRIAAERKILQPEAAVLAQPADRFAQPLDLLAA